MTRAQEMMKIAKAELAKARSLRAQEQMESFNRFLIKRFGRVLKSGDIIVVDPTKSRWTIPGPFRVVKIYFDSYPRMAVCMPRIEQKGRKVEFIPYNEHSHTLTRTDLKSARFARPDEKDGSAFWYAVDGNKPRYATFNEAFNAIRAKFKDPNVALRTFHGFHCLSVWKANDLRSSRSPHTISRQWRPDHPFRS